MTTPGSKRAEQQDVPAEFAVSKRLKTRFPSHSFKYYIHDSAAACRLQLLGELSEENVPELDGCWRTAKTTIGSRKILLDLTGLNSIDDVAKRWLISMASEGASYLPDTFLRNGLVGQPAGAQSTRNSRKPGLLGKVVSLLKGAAVEPTQAQ